MQPPPNHSKEPQLADTDTPETPVKTKAKAKAKTTATKEATPASNTLIKPKFIREDF